MRVLTAAACVSLLVLMIAPANALAIAASDDAGTQTGSAMNGWAEYLFLGTYGFGTGIVGSSYVKFDLSSITGWGTSDRAYLHMYAYAQGSYVTPDQDIAVHMATDAWSETQNIKPTIGAHVDTLAVPVGGWGIGAEPNNTPEWHTWDVTTAVASEVVGGTGGADGVLSLGVKYADETNDDSNWMFYRTREYNGGSHTAYLDIQQSSPPVPEPASCALLALAVGGVGVGLKRRRAKQ